MKRYTVIAGPNGVGKSSLRGVLEGQGIILGHVIDADMIAGEHHNDPISAGKQAIKEINECLKQDISFTQETTVAGKRIQQTMKQAKAQGYSISLFYVGISSVEESIIRIANRVRKGGHNISTEDVLRRYKGRFEAFRHVLPYCDEITFYDNENGFVKVAELKNSRFCYTNGYRPKWLLELVKCAGLQTEE